VGKYDKFGDFLSRTKLDVVHLRFEEIESIIGAKLPPSKVYPAWWSNSPWNNVLTKVWLAAGFKSGRVDVANKTVDFIRQRQQTRGATSSDQSRKPPRSALFGVLKGTSVVAPGVDLTAPVDDDWAHVYDDDYVPPSARYVVADQALSVSDKIRELDAMGISRAKVAKLLGKRYQHVRNVLDADQRKTG
jgi:hypothetical protein